MAIKWKHPREQFSCGPHGAHLGAVGPRWAPCWPHESCYQGPLLLGHGWVIWNIWWNNLSISKSQLNMPVEGSLGLETGIFRVNTDSVWLPVWQSHQPTLLSLCGMNDSVSPMWKDYLSHPSVAKVINTLQFFQNNCAPEWSRTHGTYTINIIST